MFALKFRIDFATRMVLIATFLFNAMAPTAATAMSSSGVEPSNLSTDSQGIKGSAPKTYEVLPQRASLQRSTPTVTPMPELSATPASDTRATVTAVPSQTGTPAPATPIIATEPAITTPLLSLVADPGFITADSKLVLNWAIEGVIIEEHKSLLLQITLPDELSLQEGYEGTYDETSRTLTISVTALSGQVTLLIGSSVSDTKLQAVLMDETDVLAENTLFLPVHEEFVVDERGGVVTADEGRITIEFPTDTLPERTVINVGPPSGDTVPEYSLSGNPFEIRAHVERGAEELQQFSEELTISVSYADWGIPEESESDLNLYWYNPETKEWEGLPSRVDKRTKTLIAQTDHFTVFDMDVNNWQASRLPTVDSFQVSSFTGAATYSLPIEVPPGPGGFQPSLSLNYNSQVVDQSTLKTQAPWVGMGWSLETGSIELDTHGTPNSTADDTHFLNVGGVSTRIVKDPSGVFHAADENFWKITRDLSTDSWIVKDKQGNTYTFGKTLKYPFREDVGDDAWMTHRWMLTKVSNIFGQEIVYDYTEKTKPIQFWSDGIWNWSSATTATYPKSIKYANGKYGIVFDRGTDPTGNRQDYPSGWGTDSIFHAFESYRLENIYVVQDANGNGIPETTDTVIRRYEFAYKGNAESDIIFPGYQWTAGGKTTTLKSVKQYGVGGTTALPATTFTYGDNLHLTKASNGYGGAVEFDYELWYHAADARPSQSAEVIFGDYSFPCVGGSESPWYNRTGIVACLEDEDPLYLWGPYSIAAATDVRNSLNSTYTNHSKDMVRPGGVYKLTTSISLGPGMTTRSGLFDGVRDNWGTSPTTFITLPADASKVEPLVEETGVVSIGLP